MYIEYKYLYIGMYYVCMSTNIYIYIFKYICMDALVNVQIIEYFLEYLQNIWVGVLGHSQLPSH